MVHLFEEILMPTSKRRIQIPISDEVLKQLEVLAKKRGLSLSSLSHTLIEEALEMQEDIYFSKVSEEALANSEEKDYISHEDAWS